MAKYKYEYIGEKKKDYKLPGFSKGEELFSAISHIVGGAFGIVALILGLVVTIKNGTYLGVISMIIYGTSLIVLYTMSSIYHFLNVNNAKLVFRILDHCTIFILIAGTYTPFCLITLNGKSIGIFILCFVWVLAILGVIFNAINMHWKVVKILSQTAYILMGWCILIAFNTLLSELGIAGFILLLLGGISYTVGAITFAFGTKVRYMHPLFHLFVLLGTILQFLSVVLYVL